MRYMALEVYKSAVKALVCVAWVLVGTLAQAQVSDVEVQATGRAHTSDLALRDALSKAIAQVTGVEVSTLSSVEAYVIQAEAEGVSGITSGSAIGSAQTQSSSVKVDGIIKSYRILGEHTDSENMYVVRVSAVIPKYEAAASSKRKKIALTQTKVLSATRLFDVTRQTEIRDMLDQAIESQLVQSRKFAVLSRRNLADMAKEFNLIASDGVSKAEKAKLGQMLGGDYILIPEIADANATFRTQTIQVTGQTKVTAEGGITLGMRVITAATGEIKFSDTYTASASQHPDSLGLIQAVADAAVSDLVERIFPARVISTTNDDFIINFGGDTVQEGALYRVFAEGEVMVDPYTGESLGAREQEVALAEIYRVEAKVAYARVVAGGGVNPGMVARRDREAEAQLAAPQPVKSEPKKKGVKLPFD